MSTSSSLRSRYERCAPVLALGIVGGFGLFLAGALVPVSPHKVEIYLLLTVGSTAFIVALVAWRVPAVRPIIRKVSDQVASFLGISGSQLFITTLGMVLLLASRAAAGDGPRTISPIANPLWLGGISLVILSLVNNNHVNEREKRWPYEYGALTLLFFLALILRTMGIDDIPFVLSGDEGSVGLVGWEFVEGSRDNLLGLGWFSFPALYSWLLSISQAIFGRSVFAIRLVSSIAGTLTIAASYFAGRILFNRKVGLIAAAWLASFHYHVFFSRVAYNNIFDGLFLILCIGFLYKAWNSNRRSDFLLLGVLLGFSQFFYTTSRAIPLILLLWLPWLHLSINSMKTRRTHLLSTLLIAGSITLPLLTTYLTNPDTLTFTAGRVSMLDPSFLGPAAEALGTTPLGLVLEQTLVTLLGLTVSELQGIYVASGQPMLFGLSAVVFYVGVVMTLARWRRPRSAIMLITLVISIIIGGLSIQAPNSQRLILLPPILSLIIAASLDTSREWLKKRWPRLRHLTTIVLFVILGWMIQENINQLFCEYYPSEHYGSLNGEVTQEMVELLQNESPEVDIYFIGGERMQFDSIPSIAYLQPEFSAESVETIKDLSLPSSILQRTLFFVLPEQRPSLLQLASTYPESSTIARYNRHGRLLFYVRVVDPTS